MDTEEDIATYEKPTAADLRRAFLYHLHLYPGGALDRYSTLLLPQRRQTGLLPLHGVLGRPHAGQCPVQSRPAGHLAGGPRGVLGLDIEDLQ
ncbi:MAG: hypothetical protein BA869_09845 [Desulfuromonadales bacterium C00003107]|nr:MAG: hypothetical protein BA869_09845 [Desulfuromonadales bacterium C00003107]